jgi:hypothetical protein
MEPHQIDLLSPDPAQDQAQDNRPRRLSDILQEIGAGADAPNTRISLGDLVDIFGKRAFGALLFVFAVPVALPIAIPGISAILGAPLIFLTWQLMRGQPEPWLPAVMRSRSVRQVDLVGLLRRALPYVRRLERLVGPRLSWLARGRAERVIGGLAFVLALILFLPVPFGNVVPAVSIAILALAVLERDGVAVIVGGLIGLAGLVLVSGVLFALVKAAILIIRTVLS